MAQTPRQIFIIAFVISVLASLGASLISNTTIGGEGHDGYLELAQNLLAGHGYVFEPSGHKVFHRPPLYPILLLPGASLPPTLMRAYIILLNSALFAGTVVLLFQFASHYLNNRVAQLAAAILLLNPFLLYGIKNPMSAICQMFFFTLIIFLTWRTLIAKTPLSTRHWIILTLAIFAGAISHGTMLLFDTLILLAISFRFRLAALTVFTTLLVLIAPWTFRNHSVTGLIIPVAGNSGLAYFAGNAHWGITQPAQAPNESRSDSEFRHMNLPVEKSTEWMKYYGFTDPTIEAQVNQRAIEHARTHPNDFAKKFLLNAIEYYFPVVFRIFPPEASHLSPMPLKERLLISSKEPLLVSIYHFALLTLAFVGLSRLSKSHRHLAFFLAITWALYALAYFPFLTFVGHSLYTYGTLPIIALLAANSFRSSTGLNPPATA